jgi:hypothetical protein
MNQPTVLCQHGIDCASDQPGHVMTFMRQRMGHLDAARFANAVVVGFEGDWAQVEDVFTGTRHLLWNHEDLRSVLDVDDLVAISLAYNMLAVGDERYNVACVSAGTDLNIADLI